jgi:S-ribosylhomocysteine lyase
MTWDVRMKEPNHGDYLSQGALHTIEHLFATYARNSRYQDGIIYIGPMGCRTGFYLLMAGEYTSAQIVPLITAMYEFIRDYEGDIPGAAARDCGNYLDQNPGMAAWLASRYLENTLYCIDGKHLVYPE